MTNYLMTQRPRELIKQKKEIQTLHHESAYILEIKPPTRDLSQYIEIMEGGDPS